MSVGTFADQDSAVCDKRTVRDPIGWGLGCSALLHVLVAVLFAFGLTRPLPAPPPEEVPVVVELVPLDQMGASKGSQGESGKQPEKTGSNAERPQLPEFTPSQTTQTLKAEPQARRPDLARNEPPRGGPPAEGRTPRKKPLPHDDIDALLRMAENAHRQTAAPAPTPRSLTGGTALTGPGGTERDRGQGQDGGRGVKDFIRAQIERHWEFDIANLEADGPVVSLHLELSADGRVLKADVADDPRFSADGRYRSIATSARNAALASSPLHLPPGTFDAVKDITVQLDPREALQ